MAKIVKNAFGNFLVILLIFSLVTGWIFSGWPRIWHNPAIPPKIQEAYAADTIIFTETCASNPTQPLNTSTTITVGTSWSARITLYGTPATTINSGTANCSPLADTANIGLGYTMTPAPTTNQYYVDYIWIDGGAVPASAGNGVLLNYIDANNYYACILKDDATPDAYIYKVSGGVGSTLTSNVDRTVASNAQIECRIDYNGANPVITMTNITTATQLATVTDSSSPLTKTGKAGVYCGATPAATGDDCENLLDFDTVRLSTVPDPTAPTVTTQAADPVGDTTATCKGTITATGGVNATNAGCEWDIDTGAPYANTASTAGDYGAVSFTQALTGLPAGTTIYARAFATNSGGTGYGTEVTFLTKPAAPTGVSATDTLSDKVTITWTKSTSATDYHVWRDSTDLGSAGDVATYDDTGAAAPTVTPGTASATDGSATDKVTLSISGASANNGTSYTYKVVASNATGNSADSTTDTGYRAPGSLTYQWYRSSGTGDSDFSSLGATTDPYDDTTAPAPTITAGTADASDGTSIAHVALSVSGQSANSGAARYYYCTVSATGASSQDTNHNSGYRSVGTLTYQWQRSATDSDADYSNISEATTASYNDTGAPSNGSGRYYKVVESATGASNQTSSVDRGYRIATVFSVSVSPSSTNYGTMAINQVRKADTSNANDEFIVTNTGNVPADFDIISSNAIGGVGWTLSTTAVGSSIFMHAYSTNKTLSASFTLGSVGQQATNWVAMDNDPNYRALATNVDVNGTVDLVLELLSPNEMGNYGVSKNITVTIVASAPD